MNKIFAIIGSLTAFLFGIIGLFFYGKKQGENQEKLKNSEESLKVINEVKKQSDVVDTMSSSDVRDKLRDFTTKD